MLERRIRQFKRQLQEARFRLRMMYGDFAEPLYEMIFVATEDVWRMSTNGQCIYFAPGWLQRLAPTELDFMLSHQLMHIALGHIERPEYYLGDRYHLAADIVANARLTDMGWEYDKLPHIGRIRRETFFPAKNGSDLTSVEAIRYIPIDPSSLKDTQRRQLMIDSEAWWDRREDRGENGTIVLCPQDGEPDDLAYDGPTYGGVRKLMKEFFPQPTDHDGEDDDKENAEKKYLSNTPEQSKMKAIHHLRQELAAHEIARQAGHSARTWQERNGAALDWRSILHSFVQEEVNDYSFMPPDRRMQDGDFYLPDYNVKCETVRDIYFLVDTSGSVGDEMLAAAYREIRQALVQFQGALSGIIAFFDTKVYCPRAFGDAEDIRELRPMGGGGTDYGCIFRFIGEQGVGNAPASIVIITDGEGSYPDEAEAQNIPVLWLMPGEKKAPWGRSVRMG